MTYRPQIRRVVEEFSARGTTPKAEVHLKKGTIIETSGRVNAQTLWRIVRLPHEVKPKLAVLRPGDVFLCDNPEVYRESFSLSDWQFILYTVLVHESIVHDKKD